MPNKQLFSRLYPQSRKAPESVLWLGIYSTRRKHRKSYSRFPPLALLNCIGSINFLLHVGRNFIMTGFPKYIASQTDSNPAVVTYPEQPCIYSKNLTSLIRWKLLSFTRKTGGAVFCPKRSEPPDRDGIYATLLPHRHTRDSAYTLKYIPYPPE